jgi:hypothetical protein
MTTVVGSATHQSRMSIPFLESASAWAGGIAIWLTVGAAASGIFAWYFSSRLAETKDAALQKFQQESKLALADSKTMQERVETDLAKAKEAQAVAEKSLLELQKLIREPRTVDWKKGNEILAAGPKGKVEILFADGNQEAFNLAFTIHGLLTSNGWEASIPEWASGGIPATGIIIELGGGGWTAPLNGKPLDGLPEPAKTLQKALFESVEGNPGVKVLANQQLPPGALEIMIGPKY